MASRAGIVWLLLSGVAFGQASVGDAALSTTNSNLTSHTVTLPATIEAADTLIVCFAADGNTTVTWPDMTWTSILHQTGGSTLDVAWREGDPGGGSITVTTGDATKSAHLAYRIDGAADPDTSPPEIAGANNTTGSPDPPNLAPTGGSNAYLWLACASNDAGPPTSPTAPTNFSNLQTTTATGGANTTVAGAERQLTASSQNPGTFGGTWSGGAWSAGTLALYPGAGGGGTTARRGPMIGVR